MANSNEPGIPQGGAPQGNEPPSGNVDPNQNQPKLIAGKYKNIDEAIEATVSGYHDLSEKVANTNRLLEAAMTNPQPNNGPNYGQQSGYGNGNGNGGMPIGYGAPPSYGSYGRAPDPDYIDPAAFITDPNAHLKQRDEKMMQRVSGVVGQIVNNAMVVNEWKSQNRDMVPHERIVKVYMDESANSGKPLAQRLDEAGQRTREYLAKIKGGNGSGAAPTGNDYVESPSSRQPAQNSNFAPNPFASNQTEDDANLTEWMKERSEQFQQNFGMVPPKKD